MPEAVNHLKSVFYKLNRKLTFYTYPKKQGQGCQPVGMSLRIFDWIFSDYFVNFRTTSPPVMYKAQITVYGGV